MSTTKTQPEVVYDLTEVFSASTGKLRFYGIVRVVAEIAQHFVKNGVPVRYGIFSYAHSGFLEVTPKVLADGSVDPDVPLGLRELRLRPSYARKSWLANLLIRCVNPLLQRRNIRKWREAGETRPPLDMNGKVLLSAARPKLIVDMIQILEKQGQRPEILPLLHDMIPLHKQFGHKTAYFPGKFLDDNRIILERADHVLTNSAFTRDEVIAFGESGLLPKVAQVTPIPLVHECPEGEGPATVEVPEAPYVLTVGATLGRKNLEASLNALVHLYDAGAEVPGLVVAGAARKSTVKYLEDSQWDAIRDKVIFIDSPPQADLVALYRGAVALVMASRMEGWGLPAGEALWLGTPAICSTAPVFAEVCGDLGLYFDPDDAAALVGHVRALIEDDAFAQDLRARIAEAKPEMRDWSDVARDVESVLGAAGYLGRIVVRRG